MLAFAATDGRVRAAEEFIAPSHSARSESAFVPDGTLDFDAEPARQPLQEGHEGEELLPPVEGYEGGEGFDLLPFDWVRHVGFRHSSTDGRHIGKGLPLHGTSWMNRPFHVDWFAGPLLMDDIRHGQLGQSNTVIAGLRLGRDIDYYWGLEGRYGTGDSDVLFLEDSEDGVDAGKSSYSVADISVLYYPWGDSKVRPYGILGLGMSQLDFRDQNNVRTDVTQLAVPWGVGVKLLEWPGASVRLEILDNWSFSSDAVSDMHNWSFTAGMEFRYGGKRRLYWPWRSSYAGW
ncbi:MAG: outer membrane beta-barrel protein [Planctomycetota bacterium]